MRLWTYVVVQDRGFAPNPFWGYCTLATCKPQVRQRAQAGDWIVGTGFTRKVGNGRLVFAMRVAEKLPYERYDRDPRFAKKKPQRDGISREQCGDNIYYKGSDGHWKQRLSFHRHAHMRHDLRGKYVLIGREFFYFGEKAPRIPSEYSTIIHEDGAIGADSTPTSSRLSLLGFKGTSGAVSLVCLGIGARRPRPCQKTTRPNILARVELSLCEETEN